MPKIIPLEHAKSNLRKLFKKGFEEKLNEQIELYSHFDLVWILKAILDNPDYKLTNIAYVQVGNIIEVELENENGKIKFVNLIMSVK